MNQSEIDAFIAERKRAAEESVQIGDLVQKYESDLPEISAFWDTGETSVQFNNIDKRITENGVAIYTCAAGDLWNGLFEPEIYDTNTLWDRDLHNKRKIAKVIDAWNQRQALSPLFLVEHGGDLNLGLVADGKHRLTVARAIESAMIPFMVEEENSQWVRLAFPTAVIALKTTGHNSSAREL